VLLGHSITATKFATNPTRFDMMQADLADRRERCFHSDLLPWVRLGWASGVLIIPWSLVRVQHDPPQFRRLDTMRVLGCAATLKVIHKLRFDIIRQCYAAYNLRPELKRRRNDQGLIKRDVV
jgi:hypothetical protein